MAAGRNRFQMLQKWLSNLLSVHIQLIIFIFDRFTGQADYPFNQHFMIRAFKKDDVKTMDGFKSMRKFIDQQFVSFLEGRVHTDAFYLVINKDSIFNLNGENNGHYTGKKPKPFFMLLSPSIMLTLTGSYMQIPLHLFADIP